MTEGTLGPVLIVYHAPDDPEVVAEFGPARRAADVIDADRDDCLVIWREQRPDDVPLFHVWGSGIWEHITIEQASAAVESMGDGLSGGTDR